MSEQNKEVVRRFFGAINRQDLDGLEEVIGSDFLWHGRSMGEIQGADPFKQMVASFYAAFPDLNVELNELIAERDLVVARYTVTGTHEGELSGVSGTGKRIRWEGQPIYRIDGGKVAEVWFVEDSLGLMQQIGAIPS